MEERQEEAFGPQAKKGVDYDPTFALEIFAHVDLAEEIKTCMQCGVCAASCPLSLYMDFSPRRIFNLIRAGAREQVLGAKAILLCTSCYGCKVRCPRQIPVMDVMHGLAHFAIKQGYKNRPDTINFGQTFWKSIHNLGRVDESMVPVLYMMADGLKPGLKKMMGFKEMGVGLFFHKRMKPFPLLPIRGVLSLRRMLEKAGTMRLEKEGGA